MHRVGYCHDSHFGAHFDPKYGRGSKISAKCSPITQMWHPVPFVQLQEKQVQACCMYTLILTRCSNCGGPLCTTTFLMGLSGSQENPTLNPQKFEDHSVETTSTEAALCSCALPSWQKHLNLLWKFCTALFCMSCECDFFWHGESMDRNHCMFSKLFFVGLLVGRSVRLSVVLYSLHCKMCIFCVVEEAAQAV